MKRKFRRFFLALTSALQILRIMLTSALKSLEAMLMELSLVLKLMSEAGLKSCQKALSQKFPGLKDALRRMYRRFFLVLTTEFLHCKAVWMRKWASLRTQFRQGLRNLRLLWTEKFLLSRSLSEAEFPSLSPRLQGALMI